MENVGLTLALIKALKGSGGGGGGLPAVTSADDGKVLSVENGAWRAAMSGPEVMNENEIQFLGCRANGVTYAGPRDQFDCIQYIEADENEGLLSTSVTPRNVVNGTSGGYPMPRYAMSTMTMMIVGSLYIPIYPYMFSGAFNAYPSFQTKILPLDYLGMSGYVGVICLDIIDAERPDDPYAVNVYAWKATTV